MARLRGREKTAAVLEHVERHGPCTVTAAAKALRLDTQPVGNALYSLERQGLIERAGFQLNALLWRARAQPNCSSTASAELGSGQLKQREAKAAAKAEE